jgi:hypothetical protein
VRFGNAVALGQSCYSPSGRYYGCMPNVAFFELILRSMVLLETSDLSTSQLRAMRSAIFSITIFALLKTTRLAFWASHGVCLSGWRDLNSRPPFTEVYLQVLGNNHQHVRLWTALSIRVHCNHRLVISRRQCWIRA